VLGGIAFAIGPWLAITWRETGRPVLSSQSGHALWVGNNSMTFSHYPRESIDLSTDAATPVTPPDGVLPVGENANDDLFRREAIKYIRLHPTLTARRAVLKVWAGFSWTLNPVREPLAQAVYFLSYVPVALLGIAGMWLCGRQQPLRLILALFLSFVITSAVFWAHTSHRTWLDMYLIIFAAPVIDQILRNQRFQTRR
jgi:hypothetical protein